MVEKTLFIIESLLSFSERCGKMKKKLKKWSFMLTN